MSKLPIEIITVQGLSTLAITEQQIVSGIKKYLDYLENLGKLVFIRNNTGARNVDGRFFKFGKVGSSDFIIFFPDNILFLEVKKLKGKQSDKQIEFQKKVEHIGYEYIVVDDIDKAKELIDLNLK